MAKTPEQMIAFREQRARATRDAANVALAASNLWLAASNLTQCFSNYLMQGLISWRIGSASPVVPIKAAVDALQGHKLPPKEAKELPLEQAAIVSYLVEEPWNEIPSADLVADRLLDRVLALCLRGGSDPAAWEKGVSQLREMKGTALAVETYSIYGQLLNAGSGGAADLVDQAGRLFARRAKDAFYSGGLETYGGGLYNKLTVDYRLAAILKKIGYAGDSLHKWRWN